MCDIARAQGASCAQHMMKPQPKYSSLCAQINALGACPDELALARIRRAAQAFKPHDPAGANDVLGQVSCLAGDIGAMLRHHRQAIRLSCGYRRFRRNYAMSLLRQGLLDEAAHVAGQLHDEAPGDLASLDICLHVLFLLGLQDKYAACLADWKAKAADRTHPTELLAMEENEGRDDRASRDLGTQRSV